MSGDTGSWNSALDLAETTMWERLASFVVFTGYPINNHKFLRRVGPPPNIKSVPPRGCEVFATRIPQDVLEDDLFWFFQMAGMIYDIRLMVCPSGLANRGFAFVRYTTTAEAKNAIRLLDRRELRPGDRIWVKKSAENNRLFIHGVPLDKTKTEIWDELLRNGVDTIVDVIVYKSYYPRAKNRGFAFVEFNSHEEAATAKRKYKGKRQLVLWDLPVHFDWSKPIAEADPDVMQNVTRVFIRNLKIGLAKMAFINQLMMIVNYDTVEKVYKKKNYSFIHFTTRKAAEEGLERLQRYYCGTDVEVTWSIPPSEAKKKHREMPPRFNTRTREKDTQLRKFYCRGTDEAQQRSYLNPHDEPNSENNSGRTDQPNIESRETPPIPLWLEEYRHWFDINKPEDANNNTHNLSDDINAQWFYNSNNLRNPEDSPGKSTVPLPNSATDEPMISANEVDDLDFVPSIELEKYVEEILN